jgi:hypothetical protein
MVAEPTLARAQAEQLATSGPARTQCRECPWRDLPTMPAYAVEYAQAGHLDDFVCHTRCGPCPGPRLALGTDQ